MKYSIRFAIGNRFGTGSIYSLRDLCVSIIDRYSIHTDELETIVCMQVGTEFCIPKTLKIKRIS